MSSSSHNNNRLIHKDVVLSTILTFAIFLLLKLVFVNTKYLDPLYQALSDFQFTDLYYSQYQQKQTALDTNIVLVNIGNLRRDGLAQQLEIIKSNHPKAIGLDATFIEKKDSVLDAYLKQELNDSTVPIILTSNIVYNDEEPDKAASIEHNHEYFNMQNHEGFGNFLAKEGQSVRHFKPFIKISDELDASFGARLAQIADSNAFHFLLNRNRSSEIINYQTTAYPKLDVNDIYSSAELSFLKDKIVLMGYMGSNLNEITFEDNHLTPFNKSYGGHSVPDMYGVEIHANIISMILRRDYIYEIPGWVTYLLAFGICALHMYLFIYLFVKQHKWFHLGAKIVQLVSFAIVLLLSLVAFRYLRIKVEPSYILIGVILSCDALYFYEGIVEFLKEKIQFKTYFEHH